MGVSKAESGSKSFYTVQNTEDGAGLLNDGTPWPTEPHKANIGVENYFHSSVFKYLNFTK